jgi:hypothetical protein
MARESDVRAREAEKSTYFLPKTRADSRRRWLLLKVTPEQRIQMLPIDRMRHQFHGHEYRGQLQERHMTQERERIQIHLHGEMQSTSIQELDSVESN